MASAHRAAPTEQPAMNKRDQLINDALCAGYSLLQGGRVIAKTHKGNGRILLGLVLCDDGTYFRADVDLTIANKIGTHKLARKVLGL